MNEDQSLSSTLFLLLKQLSGLECKFYTKFDYQFKIQIFQTTCNPDSNSNCALVWMTAGSSSEQINHPNSLVNLLKNLAAIASTHAYQDVLKNATSISSNDGNNAANGSIMHEQTIRSIPVRRESLAGKALYRLLDSI
jgi:hypothetical protein